jgi:AcrR family transcriptional regulator
MVCSMTRAFRQQAEDRILDRAAELFAQHGFAHTSLKTVADAVGLSKAGLLHHFPSKEALFEAAKEVGRVQGARVMEQLSGTPIGPERDARALELLVDIALDRPGLVAMAFGTIGTPQPDPRAGLIDDGHAFAFEAFGVDPAACEPQRLVRIIGALSALAVLSLAAARLDEKAAWRPHILATCFDALGHRPPTAGTPIVEA